MKGQGVAYIRCINVHYVEMFIKSGKPGCPTFDSRTIDSRAFDSRTIDSGNNYQLILESIFRSQMSGVNCPESNVLESNVGQLLQTHGTLVRVGTFIIFQGTIFVLKLSLKRVEIIELNRSTN